MDPLESSESVESGPADPAPAPAPTVSPTSVNVVARFEFEANRGNDGTKVLLVEWDSGPDEPPPEECEVDWDGKTKVLPVVNRDSSCRRLLFWLPPTAAIPPTITIIRPGCPVLHAKPLPAIFAPGLGSDVPDSGCRGVLHTLWASMRMAILEDEIAREAKENSESVGLNMALEEKEFLIHHFGLRKAAATNDKQHAVKPVLPLLATTMAPAPIHADTRSPASVRMAEKLRGLKLATSPEGLAAAASEAKSQPKPASQAPIPGLVPISGLTPMNSAGKPDDDDDDDDDGELFALPMSPRSPEMKRSPFSLLL